MYRRGEKLCFISKLVKDVKIISTDKPVTFFVNGKRFRINGTTSDKLSKLKAFDQIEGKYFKVYFEVKANYEGEEFTPEMCVIDVHYLQNDTIKYDLRFDI